MKWKSLWRLQTVVLAGGLALFAVRPATAQTAEGTVITNEAIVNWTDANSNAYTPVNATVDVTVGFQAGLSLTPDGGSQSPASPSTGGTFALTIQNSGNGTDQVQVAELITDASGVISVTNYNWNAGNYATIALLNTALLPSNLAAGASTVITVTYDVPSGKGGLSANYQLTATSVRDGGVSDAGDYDITAGETFAVAVIEQGSGNDSTTANLLPGTNQTAVFTVTNNGNGPEDFRLETSQNLGAVITVVSITGTSVTQGSNLDSAGVSGLAVSASVNVTVTFDVANLAAGTVDSLFFLATAVNDGSANDESGYIVTIVKPALAITKEAWLDNQSAEISADVLPGQFIQYKVIVTNNGTAPASSVVVTDALGALPVTYISNSQPAALWSSIVESAGTVTGTLSGTLAASGGTAYFWIRVQID
jgi:uncharacterized repeat protein (TIGR01451 family)